jgi:hypothetical protein
MLDYRTHQGKIALRGDLCAGDLGHRSGLWPYPPLGATRFIHFIAPRLRAIRSRGKFPRCPNKAQVLKLTIAPRGG